MLIIICDNSRPDGDQNVFQHEGQQLYTSIDISTLVGKKIVSAKKLLTGRIELEVEDGCGNERCNCRTIS